MRFCRFRKEGNKNRDAGAYIALVLFVTLFRFGFLSLLCGVGLWRQQFELFSQSPSAANFGFSLVVNNNCSRWLNCTVHCDRYEHHKYGGRFAGRFLCFHSERNAQSKCFWIPKWIVDSNWRNHHCLRTNNPLERLMREIRRRTRVVGAFPDGNSALMLVAARLRHVAATKWGTKRYLQMNRLAEVKAIA
jgi:hypothetical protein